MVDWVSGLADASVAERDSGYVLARIPGTPDVLKEAAISGFVTKDASGNVGLGTASVIAGLGFELKKAGAYMGVNTTTVGFSLFRGYDNGTERWAVGQIGFGGTDGIGFYRGASNTLCASFNASGHFLAGSDNTQTNGGASNRWSVVFAGTGAINTSDERAKTDIGAIPDEWLDAWADVQWRRYKFDDGVRWHTGLVAQEVHAAFADHDIDAFEIGLCCFDEWDEQREPILEAITKTRKIMRTELVAVGQTEAGVPTYVLQEVEIDEEYEETVETGETRVTRDAGDRWGLRYDECQAMEAAYQRRENARLAARIEALELGA